MQIIQNLRFEDIPEIKIRTSLIQMKNKKKRGEDQITAQIVKSLGNIIGNAWRFCWTKVVPGYSSKEVVKF